MEPVIQNDKMSENLEKPLLLSTAYAPPIEYFHFLVTNTKCAIEANENYQKQSFRNRCHILSAQGIQKLNIPIEHNEISFIRDIKISYQENWQRQHWRSINTCYRSSPFFLFYDYFFAEFYHKKEKFLFDFNYNILSVFCKILKIDTPKLTDEWSTASGTDLRHALQPKNKNTSVEKNEYLTNFSTLPEMRKFLSMYDLLFQQGPESIQILKKIEVKFH